MKTRNQITEYLTVCVLMFCSTHIINAQKGAKSTMAERDTLIQYAYSLVHGTGFTINNKAASSIFIDLYADGDAEACNALGMMYKLGRGTQPNDRKTINNNNDTAIIVVCNIFWFLFIFF